MNKSSKQQGHPKENGNRKKTYTQNQEKIAAIPWT